MTDLVKMLREPVYAGEDYDAMIEAADEIERLRDALRVFATMGFECSEAETAVPNASPVTIRCQLGDVRRAFKALNPLK